MAQERVERRLAAILAADVVGFSRLVGLDEEGTIARLRALREELIDPSIAKHQGRIVKTTGDGVLVEFPSVVDAVRCAVEAQRTLAEREADLPEDRRIEFRVGVNSGDIIVQDDDILGDGVNIAARLEGLAEPGGICIPRKVFHEVRNKLDVGYEFIGEQTVKNIETPIPVYRVLLEPEAAGQIIGEGRPGRPRWQVGVVAAAVLTLVAGGGAWLWQAQAPDFEPADTAKMAFPLPDKPSIAVLPFDNLSGDPKQDYLGDGMSENIITALSKIPNMFVIARNSTFTFKGKPVKVRQVAEELGVRYVLEGSVQRSGDRLRITAQLIDALGGHHLWAERYDREFKDIFALQDDVTRNVVTALQVELTEGEQARLWSKQTDNPRAYEYYLRGREHLYRLIKADNAQAQRLFAEAVALDPNFGVAWVALATTHFFGARFGWSEDRGRSAARATQFAQKGLAIDGSEVNAYVQLSNLAMLQRNHEQAEAYCEKALALNPTADVTAHCARIWTYLGRPQEALKLIKRAMRLSPYYPPVYLFALGNAHRMMGNYDEAIAALKAWRDRSPNSPFPYDMLAFTYAEAGREKEARAAAAELLKVKPDFTLKWFAKLLLFKDPAENKHILDVLRKLGVPENPPLKLPDRPSIAVLPFTNMSGDAEQEYFADGMTEDIITDLSKISGLFVIARNSSFQYKGKSPDIRGVGRELGVKYVLEGSVRRAGNQVRINAQLVDAANGGHLWAERYDGTLANVFALQDKVTRQIVAALAVKLTAGEDQRLAKAETENSRAYDAFLQGWEHYRRDTPEDFAKAVRFIEKAIGLDPDYGRAYAALANIYLNTRWRAGRWPEALGVTYMTAYGRAEKYLDLAMKRPTPLAHQVASKIRSIEHRHAEAIAEAERAVALDPNDADSYAALALALSWAGRAEEAVRHIERAMRLDPHYPPTYLFNLGLAKFGLDQLEDAAALMERAVKRNPGNQGPQIVLAAAYGLMGRDPEAQDALKAYANYRGTPVRILKARFFLNSVPFWDLRVAERFGTGLVKAGLCCREHVERYLEHLRAMRSPE